MTTITTIASTTSTTDTAAPNRVKLVALTQSEWDTIRVALLCHAGEQREAGNKYWAASMMEAYYQVRKQTS